MADDSAPNVGTGGGGPSEMDIDNDENDMDIQPLPGDVSGNLGVLESEEEPTMQGTSDIPTESTGEHGFDEAQAQATSAGHGTSTPAGHDLSTINPIQATSAGHETSSPYPASAGATRGEVGGYGPIRANLTEALRRSVETLDLGAIRASRGAMGSVNETRNETLEVLMAQPVSNSEVQNHELAPQRKKKHIYIYIYSEMKRIKRNGTNCCVTAPLRSIGEAAKKLRREVLRQNQKTRPFRPLKTKLKCGWCIKRVSGSGFV